MAMIIGITVKAVEPADDLPIIHINTQNNDSIKDKITQIPASLWIEIPENCTDGDWALGTEEDPVKLVIRGRGNSTWEQPKKPYKLKFDKKTSVMGLPKHKHYALNAYYGSYRTWASQVLAQDMARILELGWTPTTRPVQLILNGNFEGLYFLTESIKIDENRLDIFEQADNNEDLTTVPYGWLVEIDNYTDENQIVVWENQYYKMRITYKTPEILSDVQQKWLTDNFTEIFRILNSEDEKEKWTEYIDASTLVKYFIIREIMNDYDGFHGSVYMYKDLDSEKWSFGPIWDANFGKYSDKDSWTWQGDNLPTWCHWYMIPQIFTTHSFKDAFLREWNSFYPEKLKTLEPMMIDFAKKCSKAHAKDKERWNRSNDSQADERLAKSFYQTLESFAGWIDDNKPGIVTAVEEISSENVDAGAVYYDLCGRVVSSTHVSPGMYIIKKGNKTEKKYIR